ncbi:MAG: sigma-70 family RNA polymerase sigma factor [Anaerolineaceae bacterium]|nr:sigma-70 family RNA polymerase sigma factor [Anaerolineaceae bacterium]
MKIKRIDCRDRYGEFVNGTESEWIRQATNGNDTAFCYLVEAYQKPVFNLCYRLLGNTHDAEDAAQESFFRAYRNLKKYDPQRSFTNWLLSIASHYCIDCMRKKHAVTISTEELPETFQHDSNAPEPEKVMSKQENELRIQSLVNKLSPKDKAIIVLKYWYEFSTSDISDALSLTESSVKSRLFRARKELAGKLIDQSKKASRIKRQFNETQTI